MNKQLQFLKRIALTITLSWLSSFIFAQTNPAYQNIPYSQGFGTTTFTSAPTGIAVWTASGEPFSNQNDAENSVGNGNASISLADTIKTNAGCYGYSTSSNGRLYIQTGADSVNGTNQLVFAINTLGKKDIVVSFDVEMISAQARQVGIVFQGRFGNSGQWYTMPGFSYLHSSSDRTNGQVDNFSVSLPSQVDNLGDIQGRFAIWVGNDSSSVPYSGIAIDNLSITGNNIPTALYYRSRQSGNWNDTATWEASTDNNNWFNASQKPNYKCSTITIQTGHNVTLTASDTVDQLIINGTFTYGNNSGSKLTINEGFGSDMTVNGTFEDFGPLPINWIAQSSWEFGTSGSLIRTRNTSSYGWQNNYHNGIINMPPSANWVVRKTGSENPQINGILYFPNLIIENNTGSTWNTGTNSSFVGTLYTNVKGNLDIGGNGSGNVRFNNNNTFSKPVLVNGTITVKSGSTLLNNGTGFELHGDLNISGSLEYGDDNSRFIIFSGDKTQSISGMGSVSINRLAVNKSANVLNLNRNVKVSEKLYLIKNNINLGAYDLKTDKIAILIPEKSDYATAYQLGLSGSQNILGAAVVFNVDEEIQNAIDLEQSNSLFPSYVQTTGAGKLIISLYNPDSVITFPVGDANMCTPLFLRITGTPTYGENPSIAIRAINSKEPHIIADSNFINHYFDVGLNNVTNLSGVAGLFYYKLDVTGNYNALSAVRWTDSDSLVSLGQGNVIPGDKDFCMASITGEIKTGNYTAASICNLTAEITSSDSDNKLCSGQSDTLTVNSATSYLWSTGATTQSIVVSSGSTYTVTISNNKGCKAVDTIEVKVSKLSSVSIKTTGDKLGICKGDSIDMWAKGGTNYSWSNGGNSQIIHISPDTTTTYTVTVTDEYGCSAISDPTTISVYLFPIIETGVTDSICKGMSDTLKVSGATSYLWSTNETTPQIVVTPDSTLSYTITATSGGGCSISDTILVIVNPSPSSKIVVSKKYICAGTIDTLTAVGTGSYSWSTNQTTQTIYVSPDTNTTYTVTVTGTSGCSVSSSTLIKVNPILNAELGPDRYLCKGESITLSSDGITFLWSTGATSNHITVSPDSSQMYKVSITTCSQTLSDSVFINVFEHPNPTLGVDKHICLGDSTTLTLSGYNHYSWNTGDTNSSINVSPTITTKYTVTVTGPGGCQGNNSIYVYVHPLPNANAGNYTDFCKSTGTTNLTATGGIHYLWSTGDSTTSATIQLDSTKIYWVTVTDANGCSAKDSARITIRPLPIASAGTDKVICHGITDSLTASGGTSYLWNNNETAATISVSPVDSITYYSVTVTNDYNCHAYDTVKVSLYPMPNANAGSDTSICKGLTTTLTASGGATFNWSTSENTSTINVTPQTTTTYTVTATDANVCKATDDVKVTVYPLAHAEAGFNVSITAGASAALSAAPGGANYFWGTGDSTSAITVTPANTTTYSVTVTNIFGCTGTDDITVLVGTTQLPYPESYWQKNDSVITPIPSVYKIGIGVNNPREKLTIGGNILVDGKVVTNRITSIDSVFHIGDSSICFKTSKNNIYSDGIGSMYKGIGLGVDAYGLGLGGVSIGNTAHAHGANSYAFGYYVGTAGSQKNIVIGSSLANGDPFISTISKSLMIGFDNFNNLATFFVGPGSSNESKKTGNVGISTNDPQDRFQIGEGINSITFGKASSSAAGNLIGYQGFSVKRLRNDDDNTVSTWDINGNFGGGVIAVNSTGTMHLIPIGVQGQTTLTDKAINDRIVLSINPGIMNNANVYEGANIEVSGYANIKSYLEVQGVNAHNFFNLFGGNMMIDGNIKCKQLEVTLYPNSAPDYVFEKDYKLMSLLELEKYINQNKHLPEIPSAKKIDENGLNVGEFNALLLKKVEELTLYMIELNKKYEQVIDENKKLKDKFDKLEK